MLLAVNIPEQLPQVGHAAFSISSSSSAEILPLWRCTPPTNASIRLTVLPLSVLPCLHRPARDEDGRDIHAHRAHEHPGHDLVAVRDADHGVEPVRLAHRLDAVGDELARGEGVFHPVVPHRDPIIDADRIEQKRHAPRRPDALLDVVSDLLQMDVPGNDVDVAVADRDERLVPVPLADARRPQEAPVGGAGVAFLDGVGSHGEFGRRRRHRKSPCGIGFRGE